MACATSGRRVWARDCELRPARHREPLRRGGRELKDCFWLLVSLFKKTKDNGEWMTLVT